MLIIKILIYEVTVIILQSFEEWLRVKKGAIFKENINI